MAPSTSVAAQSARPAIQPRPLRLVWKPSAALAFRPEAELPRRLLNMVVAAIGLVLTAPLMAVIAILIKLTSRGPVLYTQTRIGLDRRDPKLISLNHRRGRDLGGAPFRIYKFRTMTARPARAGDQVWASPADPRVTPLGRFLRQYRLDELPQLWNVLRGDMNVVGPRPEQPKIFIELRDRIRGYKSRQCVRPGITGWAQINHPYDRSIDDVRRKVSYDLEYIARQSVLEDLWIMLRTLPVMLFKFGSL
jgi:lipopolysaccharide/colanic/teichoic acid biosynthesis glycosyltransferase